ncbi:uncharacterized protein LOC120010514 [Tripterygium wilfordii]|uniref:uncharacterized protein LOC120010514 n=1 Tax=Tripterygium wilfordii TaxID=458696 RepID=UPI0018F86361|nr:uncharacterized protein LOC120010514 [Tripterygium wilfordii]
MKSCALVFPDAKKLLYRWHIYRSVLANCKRLFQDKESWDAFYSSWNMLVESENEIAYVYNLAHLEVILQNYAFVVNYIKDVWLTPYKEMFVSAWTNTYLHFGNLTTNRVESQHSKLKKYLGSSQSDVKSIVSCIHQLVQAQATSIKASLEKSRHLVEHRFNTDQFRELRGFVSIDALNLIFNESEQSKVVREDSYACGCKLRTIYGLPCEHELSIYVNDSQPIPLASIDAFWKKLDLSPCVSLRDDDIDCTVELQMFAEQFKRHSQPRKFSLLRKIREIIKPSTTIVQDPIVLKSTRGRPSSKKKAELHTHCNPITPDSVEHDFLQSYQQSRHSISMGRQSSKKKAGKVTHTEPGRHSCSSLYSTPPLPTQRSSRSSNVMHEHIYVRQFPPILHPYIGSVQDVIPDGNCGFWAIAVCLGFGEHAWDTVRRDLIGELSAFWHEYVAMFGSEEHPLGVHNSLNFFELDRAAPV